MGSNYFGEAAQPNYRGNEIRGAGAGAAAGPGVVSSSSSRKGKKGNSSEKPNKQPQRGLGVAQLEKIRLNSQLSISSGTYLPSLLHHPHHHPSNFTHHQEDYRLHTAYSSPSYSSSSSPSYGFHGHQLMGMSDLDKANITYGSGDSQPSGVAARWHHGNAAAAPYGTITAPHYDVDPRITRAFFEPEIEGSFNKNKKKKKKKMMKERQDDVMMGITGGGSQNSESEEIDLELRLSL